MKERWDLNRRAVRLLCHLDRKYFLCTLFSSLTTAIAPYIPIYFSAKIIDALTAGAGGKTLALYAALTVGLAALIGLAGALLKMHARPSWTGWLTGSMRKKPWICPMP